MPEEQWYYSSQGRQLGPVTREMLRSMIVTAQVRETDAVWTPGMPQWAPAQTLPQLMKAPTPMQQGLCDHPRISFEPAGFWRRLIAALIDLIVLAALSAIVAVVVLIAAGKYAGSLDVALRVERPALTTEVALAGA